jgi:hypothetical protein
VVITVIATALCLSVYYRDGMLLVGALIAVPFALRTR